MRRRLVLDFKLAHSSKEGGAGKHEIAPRRLQTGRGNASGLVSWLAKCVGKRAQVREAEMPQELKDGWYVSWVGVKIASDEYGALRVRSHLGNNCTDDGIGLGSLRWQLGPISEPIDDITGKNT